MGTALRFNEEARACYIAQRLALAGYGVLWEPESPHVVVTSGGQPEVRQFIRDRTGTVDEWWREERIDTTNNRV